MSSIFRQLAQCRRSIDRAYSSWIGQLAYKPVPQMTGTNPQSQTYLYQDDFTTSFLSFYKILLAILE